MTTVGTNKTVWPYYAKQNVDKVTDNKDKTSLGKDDFLNILVTQLKNQDPTQPLQDREFIAQMAQFSSVEQLMNMANEMKMLRQSIGIASDLIDKEISWTVTDSQTSVDTTKTGVVDSIIMKDGKQFAQVGGESISLDKISGIRNYKEDN